MEPEHRRILHTAEEHLHWLHADATIPDNTRDQCERMLSGLLTGDNGDSGDGDRFLHARCAVGCLLGLGTPWTQVLPLLTGLVPPPEPRTTPRDGQDPALAWEHRLAYEIARTHLWALAWATPATSTADYWAVLLSLDALHEPTNRPPVATPPALGPALHHACARAALEALAAFDLDNRALLTVQESLLREWERDPGARAGDGA